MGRYHRNMPLWVSRKEPLKQLPNLPIRSLVFSLSVLAMIFVTPTIIRMYPVVATHRFNTSIYIPEESREEYSVDDQLPTRTSLKDASVLGGITLFNRNPTIGLVNMDQKEAKEWQAVAHGQMPVQFSFARVNQSLTWSDFYPVWIDEEERYGIPNCPPLPLPCTQRGATELDLVIARVPCEKAQAGRERNINRLQVLLSAASVASQQPGKESMHVLIVSECRPQLNLFPCRELLGHEGNTWLYLVNLANMRSRLALPVGSCELALSVNHLDQLAVGTTGMEQQRQAYVSMVHTDSRYVCGAIVLAHSILQSGTKRDLVMLVDRSILPEQRQGLRDAGWKVREIERIRNPYAKKGSYNEWNYSKFRLWQLVEYTKILFIDSDLLVLRNMDFLFQFPEISASGNDKDRFNSGLMVIEPSTCTFNILMDQILETKSYNGGDQGYLNEMFPWWHRLPKHVNFLKISLSGNSQHLQAKNRLFAAHPPVLYAIHYLGTKPWLCFRDYDCNWNTRHQYASDAAHAVWFRIHDSMGEHLQRHCWLKTSTKAAREAERRRAKAGKYMDDGHWRIPIQDPRLEYCLETPRCDWQGSLKYFLDPPTKRRCH